MTPPDLLSDDRSFSRRAFLVAGGTALLAGGVGRTGAAEELTPTVVVPAIDEFEGNYAGQFLTILGRESDEGDVSEVADACDDLPWPAEETERNRGQLTDRRSDEPIAVRLPVFLDGRPDPIKEDALFVINRVSSCQGEYVTLELASIDLRAVSGDPPGPNVTETEDDGAGFGLAAGAAGGGLGLLLRRLLDRE
jgi:hypothetical protein